MNTKEKKENLIYCLVFMILGILFVSTKISFIVILGKVVIINTIVMIILLIIITNKNKNKNKNEDELLNKIYNKSYKIDFKNKQIFELINFNSKQLIELEEDDSLSPKSLDYFKTSFDENIPDLKEIEKRIFYNNYNYQKNKTNKKHFLISANDDNIHYLVDSFFLSHFFILKETCYNDNDSSITEVYLNNKNETYYQITTYPASNYIRKKILYGTKE